MASVRINTERMLAIWTCCAVLVRKNRSSDLPIPRQTGWRAYGWPAHGTGGTGRFDRRDRQCLACLPRETGNVF